MTSQFLGGVQLVDNINIFAYKNDTIYWLSLYKNDKFIDFITYGPEISLPVASPCGMFVSYYQKDISAQKLNFEIWKYDPEEQELSPYTCVISDLDIALDIGMTQICFNKQSTYVIGLGEWNHVYIIDLKKLAAPIEFYIPNSCDEIRQQTIYAGPENYFAWFGQDEYVRIIDLNPTIPKMWTDKILLGKNNSNYHLNIKYFYEFNGYIVFMDTKGKTVFTKPNIDEQRLQLVFNIKYPISEYTDITIIDGKTLCFHTPVKGKKGKVTDEYMVKFD